MIAALLLAAASPAQPPFQKICGWLHNPTPANWWLTDRAGQWTLSSQGGRQAPGWEEIGGTNSGEWVETNGSYGYGCACASMRVDRTAGEVIEIRSLEPRPIKACRGNKRLPKPD